MTRYVQKGEAVDYRPTEAVAAGDVIVQGSLVGVARLDIEAGTLGSLAVVGVLMLRKELARSLSALRFIGMLPTKWRLQLSPGTSILANPFRLLKRPMKWSAFSSTHPTSPFNYEFTGCGCGMAERTTARMSFGSYYL